MASIQTSLFCGWIPVGEYVGEFGAVGPVVPVGAGLAVGSEGSLVGNTVGDIGVTVGRITGLKVGDLVGTFVKLNLSRCSSLVNS